MQETTYQNKAITAPVRDFVHVSNEDSHHNHLMEHGVSDCHLAHVEQREYSIWCSACGNDCSIIVI
jgi:hypothetical protein